MLPRTAFGAAAAGGRPAAHGVPLRAQRQEHGRLDAGGRGGRLRVAADAASRCEPFKDDLLVLTGLTPDKARPHGDGPGDHARAMAAFLTGRQPRKTDGADIRIGISVDQVAAQTVGQATRFASLEIGCEGGKNAGNCDSGYSCAYSSNLSWRSRIDADVQGDQPPAGFRPPVRRRPPRATTTPPAATRYKQSILDFVAEDAQPLQSTLGANDQRKLDEYLTGVREIEQRIAKAPPAVGARRRQDATGRPAFRATTRTTSG